MSPKHLIAPLFLVATSAWAQIAITAERLYPVSGPMIANGVVLVRDGKIEKIGPAASVAIPSGYRKLNAKVATPGLVDAHATVGLTGILNQTQDQDQVEKSAPVQPELRAIDAYDANEPLVQWVRQYGTTTVNTGHAPLALVSGQTMIAKTTGNTADAAAIVPTAMVAATLGEGSREEAAKSPGTRSKQIAMLRAELIKAQEFIKKANTPAKEGAKKDEPTRDLKLEAMVRVMRGELPLLITAHRGQDIVSAIRLGKEFGIRVVLDGVAEAQLVLPQIKASGYPVIVHPTMQRAAGEGENLSFEDAAKLQQAGIPFALQTGFEGYVPKVRVLLFEAAVAAANGLTFDQALYAATLGGAKVLGVESRVGSLEAGKDADVALFDGDPFEFTSHCTAVVIDGKLVEQNAR